MKILDLPLKAVWYNMIENGPKTEEYREIKPYWIKRLYKEITHVRFRYGYTNRTMLFELKSIRQGKGKPEWGAPNTDVFILELGNKITE